MTPESIILAARFHDSAYAGSMYKRADGDFVNRYDPVSLAGALLALLHASKRETEDALISLEDIAAERDALKAAHAATLEDLMAQHGISVWEDPDWCRGRWGTPRWLAGVGLHAENGEYYSTLTGRGSASFEAKHTAAGETPFAAAAACAAKAAGGAA